MPDPFGRIYVPTMLRDGRSPGEIVTLVIHRLGVIDVRWSESMLMWTWLRVRKSFVPLGEDGEE